MDDRGAVGGLGRVQMWHPEGRESHQIGDALGGSNEEPTVAYREDNVSR